MACVLNKIVTYASLPRFQKCWFFPAWIMLGFARGLVMLVPFRLIASWLGEAKGIAASVPLATPEQEYIAQQIGRTIRLAARYTPWDANCFAQAIAARMILQIYGVPYSLFFGLSRNAETGLDAHAWTASGRVAVTGGYSFDRFTVVGLYTG